jgi:predicted HTH domain antitoxin
MTKQITKSLRLTAEEARQLAELAADAGLQESALLREWVVHGIRAARIEHAVDVYDRGDADLREAAALASIPIGVMVDELAERHIPLLRDPEIFERELEHLRATFGDGRIDPSAPNPGEEPAGESAVAGASRSRSHRRTG